MIYLSTCASPLGLLTLQSDGRRLTGLWMEGQKHFGGGQPPAGAARDDLPLFIQARDWLHAYFSGGRPAMDALPLAPAGSVFRQRVYDILRAVPYGAVISYGQIAEALGGPALARAAGGAVAHNPISIIIPCHRVLGAGGGLTGYAGGLERKLWLLRHEGVDLEGLTRRGR